MLRREKCDAGTMGLQGNLTAGEIVEQLAYAMRFSGIRNIVFMGMGEPLNNYNAVKVCTIYHTGASVWMYWSLLQGNRCHYWDASTCELFPGVH